MFGETIRLNSGLKVHVLSDNDDCTLHVLYDDVDSPFEISRACPVKINYSEVAPEDRHKLSFYKAALACQLRLSTRDDQKVC